jgi:hypothetical protein
MKKTPILLQGPLAILPRTSVIYRNDSIRLQSRTGFTKALTSTARYVDQPMLLGLAGSKLFLEMTRVQQSRDIAKFGSIRHSTGLFNWDPKTDDILEVDASGLNYGRISRRLASTSARINQCQFMLSTTLSSATSMLQEHNKTSQKSASGAGGGKKAADQRRLGQYDVGNLQSHCAEGLQCWPTTSES